MPRFPAARRVRPNPDAAWLSARFPLLRYDGSSPLMRLLDWESLSAPHAVNAGWSATAPATVANVVKSTRFYDLAKLDILICINDCCPPGQRQPRPRFWAASAPEHPSHTVTSARHRTRGRRIPDATHPGYRRQGLQSAARHCRRRPNPTVAGAALRAESTRAADHAHGCRAAETASRCHVSGTPHRSRS